MSIVRLPGLGSGGLGFLSFLGAVAGEVPGLVAVEAVPSGRGGGGSCIVLETAGSLPSVSLGPAKVHWHLDVVVSSRGIRGVELILGAVPLVRLVGSIPLVVLGPSISSKSLPVSRSCGGASFQVSEGSERPPGAYTLGCSRFYGLVGVNEGWT